MRPVVRVLLIVVICLTTVGTVGVWYLNKIFLPVKVRGWAEGAATEALGRKVSIGQLKAHLWHGIQLKQVTIEEDSRYGLAPFLEVEQISGGLLLLPIFKSRVVMIPTLRLTQPRARLIQDANGLWNIESLKHAASAPTPQGSPLRLVVSRVVVENGQLVTEIRNRSSPLLFDLEGIQADAHLSLPARIECSVSAHLLSESPPPVDLKGEGIYEIPRKEFHLKGQADVPLMAIPEYLPPRFSQYNPLFRGNGLVKLDLKGNRTGGPLALKATLQTQGLQWKLHHPKEDEEDEKWQEQLHGAGDFLIEAEGAFADLEEIRQRFPIQGTVTLQEISLGPLPTLGELNNLNGQIAFDSKGLRTERLTAKLASGQPLEVTGSLLNDEPKSFSLKAQTTLPLAQIPSYFPKTEPYTKNATLLGEIALSAVGKGHLRPSLQVDPDLTALLRQVGVQFLGKNLIQEVSGTLSLKPDLFTVTQLQGRYDGEPFLIQGSLVNFLRPEIDAQFSWGKFSADLRATLDGALAQIHELAGRYQEATFRLLGEISGIPAPGAFFSAGTSPTANLYGELEFDLEDLSQLLSKPPAWISSYPMKGHLSTRWMMQGNLLKRSEWKLNLKAHSPYLTIREIPLEQLAMELNEESGNLTLRKAQADMSGGRLSLTGSYALHEPINPWTAQLHFQNLELKTVAQHLHWKTQEISGKLFAHWEGEGQGNRLETVSGNGKLQVRGARILEIPFLGQFADLLKLPHLKTIAFEEAEGPFSIGAGQLQTRAFLLKGPQATLTITGSGGFLKGMDSPIDWVFIPTLSPELIPEETRSKIGKAIAAGASYLIGEIRMTGTWRAPQRIFVSKPMTQILNEQIFNLQDLLKDLF